MMNCTALYNPPDYEGKMKCPHIDNVHTIISSWALVWRETIRGSGDKKGTGGKKKEQLHATEKEKSLGINLP